LGGADGHPRGGVVDVLGRERGGREVEELEIRADRERRGAGRVGDELAGVPPARVVRRPERDRRAVDRALLGVEHGDLERRGRLRVLVGLVPGGGVAAGRPRRVARRIRMVEPPVHGLPRDPAVLRVEGAPRVVPARGRDVHVRDERGAGDRAGHVGPLAAIAASERVDAVGLD
ncbi:MAG: hypothetical protein ACK559_11265, partial [bacterium]